MSLTLAVICMAALFLLIALWTRRRRDQFDQQQSITPEALHTLLTSNREVLVFDVRQPLDLLANSVVIPGAKRIPPKEVLENPSLIPKEKETVVYCTCPSDKTSRSVSHQARALQFTRMKFLKGGLEAWKAKGYPVEPYTAPFHLDTQT